MTAISNFEFGPVQLAGLSSLTSVDGRVPKYTSYLLKSGSTFMLSLCWYLNQNSSRFIKVYWHNLIQSCAEEFPFFIQFRPDYFSSCLLIGKIWYLWWLLKYWEWLVENSILVWWFPDNITTNWQVSVRHSNQQCNNANIDPLILL